MLLTLKYILFPLQLHTMSSQSNTSRESCMPTCVTPSVADNQDAPVRPATTELTVSGSQEIPGQRSSNGSPFSMQHINVVASRQSQVRQKSCIIVLALIFSLFYLYQNSLILLCLHTA